MDAKPHTLPFAEGDHCWNCRSTVLHRTKDPDAPHGYKCHYCPAIPATVKVERALEAHRKAMEPEVELAAALDRLTQP